MRPYLQLYSVKGELPCGKECFEFRDAADVFVPLDHLCGVLFRCDALQVLWLYAALRRACVVNGLTSTEDNFVVKFVRHPVSQSTAVVPGAVAVAVVADGTHPDAAAIRVRLLRIELETLSVRVQSRGNGCIERQPLALPLPVGTA